MKKPFQFLLLPLCLAASTLFSQSQLEADTILEYNIATHVITTILPQPFNSNLTSDFTSSNVGSLGNKTMLNVVPPTNNLFPGSSFSDLAPASNFFALTNYPMRTALQLHIYYDDSLSLICTGMMVGPCMVLTSANSVYSFGTHSFKSLDSIRVLPAFNNGAAQTSLPASLVKKCFLFKKFYDQTKFEDIALLELNDNIGNTIGWTGIGFSLDSNFLTNKVFHKFSYPSKPSLSVPNRIYNGDTLYYNYGFISDMVSWYVVTSNAAEGIVGQNGSTFMYTDNTNYYSVGLLSFSSNYMHYKINNAAFYRLKNVMNASACNLDITSTNDISNKKAPLRFFPNPLHDESILEFEYDPAKQYLLRVTNNLGQEVKTISVTGGRVSVTKDDLPKGSYVLHLNNNKGEHYTHKLLVD